MVFSWSRPSQPTVDKLIPILFELGLAIMEGTPPSPTGVVPPSLCIQVMFGHGKEG